MLKYGIAALLANGGGNVVNTSSTAGLTAQDNIRVIAVAPEAVLTPIVQNFIDTASDPKAMQEHRGGMNPILGMPTPAYVADSVLFLASDEAKWIIGHTLPIDGGYVAR